jgi:hypothetical protein
MNTGRSQWTPAFAGVTGKNRSVTRPPSTPAFTGDDQRIDVFAMSENRAGRPWPGAEEIACARGGGSAR